MARGNKQVQGKQFNSYDTVRLLQDKIKKRKRARHIDLSVSSIREIHLIWKGGVSVQMKK